MAYVWTIVGYMTLLLCVGVYLARRVKGQDDFMVAGRSLTAPILVGTLLATWIGSGDIFSVADLSYRHGYSSLIGSAGGWIGIIIVFFIAGRVRRFGQFTVPDILEARYDHRARILATLTTVIAYVTIVSYQFRGGGWVIELISDGRISESQAILGMAVFVVVYTLTAGMLSVAYLDLINGIVMLLGFFIAVPVLLYVAGGPSELMADATPRAQPDPGQHERLAGDGLPDPHAAPGPGQRQHVPALLLGQGRARGAPFGRRLGHRGDPPRRRDPDPGRGRQLALPGPVPIPSQARSSCSWPARRCRSGSAAC